MQSKIEKVKQKIYRSALIKQSRISNGNTSSAGDSIRGFSLVYILAKSLISRILSSATVDFERFK